MTPQSYCREVCKKSASNFVYTFYLFGRRRRRALQAFYAFCRLVDDSVDQAPSLESALEAIRFWKAEVIRLYEGKPSHPVTHALLEAMRLFPIPREHLQGIVEGCEMDLTRKAYATFEELESYCYRVASCVGLVCLPLFGVAPSGAVVRGACALGKALQLTNILRDIASDWKRGRCYIPQEDLQKFRVAAKDLPNPARENLNLTELLYFEIGRARDFFEEAWDSFPLFGNARRRLLAARLMGRFYEAILNKISRDPLRVFREKVGLTAGEKIRIAAREVFKL